MAFKIDFEEGEAKLWKKEGSTTVKEIDRDYRPRFYVSGDKKDLKNARTFLQSQEGICATDFRKKYLDLDKDSREEVLRVDALNEEKLKKSVYRLKSRFSAGIFRFYNVDLSPQFRYCIQNEINPYPEEELSKMKIELDRESLANKKLNQLKLNGEKIAETNREVVKKLRDRLEAKNPDILIINRSDILPAVKQYASRNRIGFKWGREPGLEKLAGENTVTSYGQTMHSSQRYNIPGRAIINTSNSFMYSKTDLSGLMDLVDRSWKPIQELAWGSIGNLLTAIETRKAYIQEDILIPWKNWTPETPKKASKLHKGDRGGFIFNPEPGVHRDVYEVDFASMYPNIMINKNISPETVCCNCCSNDKVPELGFSICQEKKGFISEVLTPLVEERQQMKEEAANSTGERKEKLENKSDAIKWLLVTCFGYMGHAHASFGAIECHQAINAYARDMMLTAKEIFEDNGWRIEHGIVDSLWISKAEENPTPLDKVCRKVTEEVGIELEQEHDFDWIAFVPRKNQKRVSTLNRYFGKTDEKVKKAGIETEQSSSFDLQKKMQKEMINRLDENSLDKYEALEVLENYIRKVEDREVSMTDLVITKKPSKSLENYRVDNNTKAAMLQYRKRGVEVRPGEKVRYIVRKHGGSIPEKVRIPRYAERYDSKFYRDKLVSAAASVLSPFGLSEKEIESEIRNGSRTKIDRFM